MAAIAEDEMRAIVRKIARIDPAFAPIIKDSPLCTIGLKKYSRSHFETLINSIISQQLAVKAADTIIKRVNDLVDGRPKPETISKLSATKLREVGVSGAKARSMHELSNAIIDGDLNFHRFPKLSNQEISDELTKIWGIGRWTSEMFLMFHLGRLNVWPVGDLGMRRGWEKLHRMRTEINPKKLDVMGNKFEGFQSVVAWYCWRVTDSGDTVNW
jgi:DNA-3-methyladenine glycosylase II